MPSFLSKLGFGSSSSNKQKENGTGSLLGEKFEAVSKPSISPSATPPPAPAPPPKDKGIDKEKEKENVRRKDSASAKDKKDKDAKPKSKEKEKDKEKDDPPHLDLNLSLSSPSTQPSVPAPAAEERRPALGNVLDEAERAKVLDDAQIARTRVGVKQALALLNACSEAIYAHGLETLGLMHPHWHSANPDTQRRLISLFLSSQSQDSSENAQAQAFTDEVRMTFSPHDVAAVLRWGLRHLDLSLSTSASPHSTPIEAPFGATAEWYYTFSEKERSATYPKTAYSETLLPMLPSAHRELLNATLDLTSALAAHSESNGVSGSRFAKLVGVWVLTRHEFGEGKEGWEAFYKMWERTGRILEHLFLARVRDESSRTTLPRRLTELIAQYPYSTSRSAQEDGLLPRPRFSTRQHAALYVRVESALPASAPLQTSPSKKGKKEKEKEREKERPKPDAWKVLKLAFAASVPAAEEGKTDADAGEKKIWETIRSAALPSSATAAAIDGEATDEKKDESISTAPKKERAEEDHREPDYAKVFSHETLRLLSSIPAAATSPASSPGTADKPNLLSYTSSFNGLHDDPERTPVATPRAEATTPKVSVSTAFLSSPSSGGSPSPTSTSGPGADKSKEGSGGIALDWTQFSTSGFFDAVPTGSALASTLMDRDVETTRPSAAASPGAMGVLGKVPSMRTRKSLEERAVAKRRGGGVGVPPVPELNRREREEREEVGSAKVVRVGRVRVDEAFVDFWGDAVSDGGSGATGGGKWPSFVLARLSADVVALLKGSEGEGEGGETPEYVVFEHVYATPVPKVSPINTSTEDTAKDGKERRPSSPGGKSEVSSVATSPAAQAKKRFSLFGRGSSTNLPSVDTLPSAGVGGASATTSAAKRGKAGGGQGGGVRVGEMGEIVEGGEEPVKEDGSKEKEKDKEVEKKEKDVEKEKAALALASVRETEKAVKEKKEREKVERKERERREKEERKRRKEEEKAEGRKRKEEAAAAAKKKKDEEKEKRKVGEEDKGKKEKDGEKKDEKKELKVETKPSAPPPSVPSKDTDGQGEKEKEKEKKPEGKFVEVLKTPRPLDKELPGEGEQKEGEPEGEEGDEGSNRIPTPPGEEKEEEEDEPKHDSGEEPKDDAEPEPEPEPAVAEKEPEDEKKDEGEETGYVAAATGAAAAGLSAVVGGVASLTGFGGSGGEEKEEAEPVKEEEEEPEPEPVKEATPEPEPAKEPTPEPEPTKEPTPEPEPVKETTPEPEPVKEATPEPEPEPEPEHSPVQEIAPEVDPGVEEAASPILAAAAKEPVVESESEHEGVEEPELSPVRTHHEEPEPEVEEAAPEPEPAVEEVEPEAEPAAPAVEPEAEAVEEPEPEPVVEEPVKEPTPEPEPEAEPAREATPSPPPPPADDEKPVVPEELPADHEEHIAPIREPSPGLAPESAASLPEVPVVDAKPPPPAALDSTVPSVDADHFSPINNAEENTETEKPDLDLPGAAGNALKAGDEPSSQVLLNSATKSDGAGAANGHSHEEKDAVREHGSEDEDKAVVSEA